MEISGYKIQRTIGQGGMATVYLAIQESLGRPVVLKVLDTTDQSTPESVERFLNEGRIVAGLNHPHIITIYDIGISEDQIYISMEYVEGGDLRDRMGRPMAVEEALDIVVKIASALSAAHKKGIVHRDVKPANILFRKDGTPLLSDFGIAKKLTMDHDLTSTGIFLGSPNYMAPEQAEGGPIDGRADIYALGIIFYEMVTGKKPYQSESVISLLVQHKQAPIPKLPEGLERYQHLLDLMLAKHRNDRFRDAASLVYFVHKLQTIYAQPDLDATPPAGTPKPVMKTRPAPRAAARPAAPAARSAPPAKEKPRSNRLQTVLIILLALTSAGFASLYYIDARLNRGPVDPHGMPHHAVAAVAPHNAAPGNTAAGTGSGSQKAPPPADLVKALTWLGWHSLQEYRLTAPPKDNAYYYYSRLLELDPGNKAALKGIQEVAHRFAFLAERELANNNYDKARSYAAVGLQIDPGNKTLLELKSLAGNRHKGLFERIRDFFRSG